MCTGVEAIGLQQNSKHIEGVLRMMTKIGGGG